MPRKDRGIFAVRHKQYKAHFWTEGSSLSCGSKTCDPDCKNGNLKRHDPPLLFDLHLDPSEQYNLSNDSSYEGLISEITQLKKQYDEKMVFGLSQIKRGGEKDLDPCCSPKCSPFPQCCRCSSSGELKFSSLQTFLFFISNINPFDNMHNIL